MALDKWFSPEALASALSSELDNLANSTTDTTGFTTLSPEFDNESSRFKFGSLELNLAAQGGARSSGAFVEVWIAYAVDSTPNYPATGNAALTPGPLRTFQLDAATTARRLTIVNIPLAPFKFKLYVRNVTGQALATGNTLKIRRHYEEIA